MKGWKAFLFSVAVDPGFVDHETAAIWRWGNCLQERNMELQIQKLNIMWNLYMNEKTSQQVIDSSKLKSLVF